MKCYGELFVRIVEYMIYTEAPNIAPENEIDENVTKNVSFHSVFRDKGTEPKIQEKNSADPHKTR